MSNPVSYNNVVFTVERIQVCLLQSRDYNITQIITNLIQTALKLCYTKHVYKLISTGDKTTCIKLKTDQTETNLMTINL